MKRTTIPSTQKNCTYKKKIVDISFQNIWLPNAGRQQEMEWHAKIYKDNIIVGFQNEAPLHNNWEFWLPPNFETLEEAICWATDKSTIMNQNTWMTPEISYTPPKYNQKLNMFVAVSYTPPKHNHYYKYMK